MISRGFIIDKFDYRENDVIVTLITENHGILNYFVPNGKKKEGFLQFCDLIEFLELKTGKRRDSGRDHLTRITQLCLLKSNFHKFDGSFSYAATRYLLKTIKKLVPQHINTPRLYSMMMAFPVNDKLQFIEILVALLKYLGFYPDIKTCGECGSCENLSWAVPEDMMILCSRCSRKSPQEKIPVAQDFFKILAFIDARNTGKLVISEKQFTMICNFFTGYLELNHEIDSFDYSVMNLNPK